MNSCRNPPGLPNGFETEVAIVGAGPVGLLLANLLGARGVRTCLFEKRTQPQTSSMAIGITPPSLEILKRLGLDGVFREAGVPVRHAEVYEAKTRVGRLDFAGIASDYPFFLSLPQARTVEILRTSLARIARRGLADQTHGWNRALLGCGQAFPPHPSPHPWGEGEREADALGSDIPWLRPRAGASSETNSISNPARADKTMADESGSLSLGERVGVRGKGADSVVRSPEMVTIHDGHEFCGLRQDADGVTAAFRNPKSGMHCEVRARFLVGADGHKSAVRVAAGLAVREKPYRQRFIMADFEDDSRLGAEARLFFAADASVESFPLPGGQRRWIVQVTGEDGATPVDYLIANVRSRTGYDLSDRPVHFVSTFGAKRMIVESYHAGRMLLAGDAAHVMSPVGGQGMNTGFADAEMLAEILPLVLEQPDRMARYFAAYDRIRRRSFEVAARRAERGMWLGTLRGRLASWCRKHFIRDVLFSRWMERHLAPHFAMLTIPYRNLNRVPRDWLAAD
jgi:2-polyprenyl-6-methoxyphenol hydroxylase-like FAD-dependent oxidoreductase